jgi:hypothetical protein
MKRIMMMLTVAALTVVALSLSAVTASADSTHTCQGKSCNVEFGDQTGNTAGDGGTGGTGTGGTGGTGGAGGDVNYAPVFTVTGGDVTKTK